MDDDLRQHRIVEGRHFGPLFDPAVYAGAGRKNHLGQAPRRGLETCVRHLGVKAGLYGGAFGGEGRAREGILVRRLPDHPFHKVDAKDRLGHRMLDLQPRVDLEKGKVLTVGVIDELHRPGAFVLHRGAKAHRRRMEGLADGFGQSRRGRLFDDLLVAALKGAVPLSQSHHPAPPVAKDLHLDVAGPRHEPLQKHPGVAETRARHALHARQGRAQRPFIGAKLHPDAAAACGAFQHHRVSDPCSLCRRMVGILQQPRPRQQGHPRRLR